jgi:serine phosphatase RsbU (regulator of sigma subunit)
MYRSLGILSREEFVIARQSSFLRKMVAPLLAPQKKAVTTIPAASLQSIVISKACDAESGDYYIELQKAGHYIACIGDAMGHGEEAFCLATEMKRILNIALRSAIDENPGYLLKYCNFLFHLTNCSGRNFYDRTSDLAILDLDTSSMVLKYSSAKINIILVRNGNAVRLKKNKCSVGDKESRFDVVCHTVQLKKGDRIFAYTDGVPDQFGGPKNKRLKNKGLEGMLLGILEQNPHSFESALSIELDRWKAGTEQTDDMTLLSVSV